LSQFFVNTLGVVSVCCKYFVNSLETLILVVPNCKLKVQIFGMIKYYLFQI
jgi:hypothetical protein